MTPSGHGPSHLTSDRALSTRDMSRQVTPIRAGSSKRSRNGEDEEAVTPRQRAAATHVTSLLLGSSAQHHEPAVPHPFSSQRAVAKSLRSQGSFKVVTNAVVREVDPAYDLSFPDLVVRALHRPGCGFE